MAFEPHQFSAGCITNVRWCQPVCDLVIFGLQGSGRTDPGTNCYNESSGDATSIQNFWRDETKCSFISLTRFPVFTQLGEFATQL